MRLFVGVAACAGLAAASLALADNPTPASDAAPPPAAAMTPAGSQPAATPAPKAAPTADKEAKEAVEREKHFKAEGYRVRVNSGKKYWCITDTSTGSHIPKEQCYTEDALITMESKAGGQTLDRGNSSMRSGLNSNPIPNSGR